MRSHINVSEFIMFIESFKVILNNELNELKCKGIEIVSDSQNCINKIAQITFGSDDIGIELHKELDIILGELIVLKLPNDFIQIRWVHSHADSNYNEYVDEHAKISALLVMFLGENITSYKIKNNDTYHPNNYISYKTIKSEIRYLGECEEEKLWDMYTKSNKNKRSNHYDKYGIKLNRKIYGDELYKLTIRENTIRMMIYTNQLPTNMYLKRK